MAEQLTDPFGRRFPYLRLSVTDVCNFRCSYCLPDGYKKTSCDSFLSVEEIGRLALAFTGMGTYKIRLTGGEPTLRKDFLDIARVVANTPGIRKVALTTNGYKLPQRAKDYYAAGVRALNISIDSLQPERFQEITGHNRLAEVLDGLKAAQDAGFSSIKINAVLLKNTNEDELESFLEFIRTQDISLRFIELMRTLDNQDYFQKYHLSAEIIRNQLLAKGWQIAPREKDAGPAVDFFHQDYVGRIGLIAPYSKDFCKTCNRLRISARGDLHLCLFGEGGQSVRQLLQQDDQLEELQETIMNLMNHKRVSHFLHQGDSGATPHLASIGG